MKEKDIIEKIVEILSSNNKYLYRSWSALASELGINNEENKLELLKILLNNSSCELDEKLNFVVYFNSKNYDPNTGPLFALQSAVKETEIDQKNVEKEERRGKKQQKNTHDENGERLYQEVHKPKEHIAEENIKNATTSLIKIQTAINKILEKYSISLFKNNEEAYKQLEGINLNMRELIVKLMISNNLNKKDLLGDN